MKNLIIISLLLLSILACKNKKKIAKTEPVKVAKTTPSYKASDMVASIDRSMCFGACPAYKMEIYGDGKVVYKGRRFVKNIGTFTGHTSIEKINLLLAKANEINYFSLKDIYDNKSVTDLPSTETSIFINGIIKNVYSRYNTPKELTAFQKYFDELFKEIELTKVE